MVKTAIIGHVCSHSKGPQHPTAGVHGATPVTCPAASADTHVPSPPAAPGGGWGPGAKPSWLTTRETRVVPSGSEARGKLPLATGSSVGNPAGTGHLDSDLGGRGTYSAQSPCPGAWHETLRPRRTSVSLLPPSPGKLPGGWLPPKPREERSLPPGEWSVSSDVTSPEGRRPHRGQAHTSGTSLLWGRIERLSPEHLQKVHPRAKSKLPKNTSAHRLN